MSDFWDFGKECLLPFFVGCLLTFLLAASATSSTFKEIKELKAEAVKRGHAVFVTDENNDVKFEWKKIQTEK